MTEIGNWKKIGEMSTLLGIHIKERCSLTLGFFSPSVIASHGFDIGMSGKAPSWFCP
jgi:hypothetical protein